jgi:hypothetical protein
MKLVSALLAAAIMSALVTPLTPPPASACSCFVGSDESFVSSMLGHGNVDAVVVGHVAERNPGDPETVTFVTERQFYGEHRYEFVVRYSYGENSQCPGYTVTEDTRHLLWLERREPRTDVLNVYGLPETADPPGVYTPIGCHLSQIASTTNSQETIATFERMGTAWPPDGGSVWLPWAFAAGVLAAIAGAVLVISRRTHRSG